MLKRLEGLREDVGLYVTWMVVSAAISIVSTSILFTLTKGEVQHRRWERRRRRRATREGYELEEE